MGLIKLLAEDIGRTLSDDQGSWRQFILDHLDYIAQRTVPSSVENLLINQYRFDLKRFLKERMSRQKDIAWIVLLLNNMGSDLDFYRPGIYIIPTDDLINRLYGSYITIESNSF